jgi:branched-chain amino acid transport system substrate-binding protein
VRRALPILLAVLAASLSACGDDAQQSTRVHGDTLTIYASLPAHGLDARAGAAAALGMRSALAEAGGRAGGRTVRLVQLSSTRPGDATWDPGTVEANADRAAEDATTIAYLGELDGGASAVSLPVTNREQILQVSPADALTSLTRTPPGRPSAGPERYYPEQRRTFVRLVPADLAAARRIVAELHERQTRRVAIVTGDGIADHELEGMILGLVGTGQPRTVARIAAPSDDEDPESVGDLVGEVAEADPQAIVYVAADGPRTRAAVAALGARLPAVPLLAGPEIAGGAVAPDVGGAACARAGVPAAAVLSEPGRRRLARLRRRMGRRVGVETLLGYDAMRLALASIDSAGPDRRAVVKAAKAAQDEFRPCR